MKDHGFELLSAEEMRRKYKLTAENRPTLSLDAARVPARLRALAPLAEFWGVSDDLIRADLLRTASREAVAALKQTVAAHEDELDDWLAGPEADSHEPSPEYLAFSNMRMAADGA